MWTKNLVDSSHEVESQDLRLEVERGVNKSSLKIGESSIECVEAGSSMRVFRDLTLQEQRVNNPVMTMRQTQVLLYHPNAVLLSFESGEPLISIGAGDQASDTQKDREREATEILYDGGFEPNENSGRKKQKMAFSQKSVMLKSFIEIEPGLNKIAECEADSACDPVFPPGFEPRQETPIRHDREEIELQHVSAMSPHQQISKELEFSEAAPQTIEGGRRVTRSSVKHMDNKKIKAEETWAIGKRCGIIADDEQAVIRGLENGGSTSPGR